MFFSKKSKPPLRVKQTILYTKEKYNNIKIYTTLKNNHLIVHKQKEHIQMPLSYIIIDFHQKLVREQFIYNSESQTSFPISDIEKISIVIDSVEEVKVPKSEDRECIVCNQSLWYFVEHRCLNYKYSKYETTYAEIVEKVENMENS